MKCIQVPLLLFSSVISASSLLFFWNRIYLFPCPLFLLPNNANLPLHNSGWLCLSLCTSPASKYNHQSDRQRRPIQIQRTKSRTIIHTALISVYYPNPTTASRATLQTADKVSHMKFEGSFQCLAGWLDGCLFWWWRCLELVYYHSESADNGIDSVLLPKWTNRVIYQHLGDAFIDLGRGEWRWLHVFIWSQHGTVYQTPIHPLKWTNRREKDKIDLQRLLQGGA